MPTRPAACILASAAVAFLFLALPACEDDVKVPLPTSDATPPTLVWNVFNYDTNDQADHAGNPTISVQRGAMYRVMLKANDPEGVESIEMNPTLGSGSVDYTCSLPSSNVAQAVNVTIGPQAQNLSPDGDGNVLTSIFLLQDLGFDLGCQPGWVFAGGSAHLTGRASNYFNGVTTSTITFIINP